MSNKEQKLVAALENGTVIDHIPTDKLFTIAQLLEVSKCTEPVLIGNNLESKMMGKKGLIKISGKFFTEAEISKLAVVAKRQITLPETLTDIVKCANPVCITNNEPMKTVFYLKGTDTLKCRYCGKEQKLENIKLK